MASVAATRRPVCGYNSGMSVAAGVRVEVGVRELKNALSAYLDRVQAGDEVIVTERGRPIARLTTLSADVDRLTELIEAGIVTPSTAPRRLPTRRVRLRGEGTIADLVAEQRR